MCWYHWISLWNVARVFPKTASDFFASWQTALPPSRCNKIWRMGFYAITWSIWLARNDKVFNDKACIADSLVDTIRLRVAHWAIARWPCCSVNIMDIVRLPTSVSVPTALHTSRGPVNWVNPDAGFMKFNTDGASSSSSGLAGNGGVLRDHRPSFNIAFSKAVGYADSNLGEMLAAKEAMLLFSKSPWANSSNLILESDSTNMVKWLSEPSSTPWRL
ncbi:hypothetical protein PTKIN_Ptkin09bG0226900 [Pterospermum kingtungense]